MVDQPVAIRTRVCIIRVQVPVHHSPVVLIPDQVPVHRRPVVQAQAVPEGPQGVEDDGRAVLPLEKLSTLILNKLVCYTPGIVYMMLAHGKLLELCFMDSTNLVLKAYLANSAGVNLAALMHRNPDANRYKANIFTVMVLSIVR